jgi:hypothetical protein
MRKDTIVSVVGDCNIQRLIVMYSRMDDGGSIHGRTGIVLFITPFQTSSVAHRTSVAFFLGKIKDTGP